MPGGDIADGWVSGVFEFTMDGYTFGRPLLERPTVIADQYFAVIGRVVFPIHVRQPVKLNFLPFITSSKFGPGFLRQSSPGDRAIRWNVWLAT